MGFLAAVSIDDIRNRGSIRDKDVMRLRSALYEDHSISESEATALIALNDGCVVKDPSWAAFFVEALTDFIVNQMKPEGYVTAENAAWLIERIGRDGRVESHTELELLVNVLDKARWSPPSLAAYALQQVKIAVTSGAGPIRSGLSLEPGVIGEAEVDLVRRIVYAFGGDGGIAVTRPEAQMLLAINRAVLPGKSCPAWTELFVKAVGNAVLGGLGYNVPSREQALAFETSADAASPAGAASILTDALWSGVEGDTARSRLGGFFGRMMSGAPSVWSTARPQSSEERAMARLERHRIEIITSERIDEVEENWLLAELGPVERLTDNERALLAFLGHEASLLPPRLESLIKRSAVAA